VGKIKKEAVSKKIIKIAVMKNVLKKHGQSAGAFIYRYGMPLVAVLLSPALGYSQATPPPPTGGSGGGSSPDSPLGVPFDYKLNLLFLLAAVIFAVVIMRKSQKKIEAKKIPI
jgi:hypothetical protein